MQIFRKYLIATVILLLMYFDGAVSIAFRFGICNLFRVVGSPFLLSILVLT